MSEQKIYPTSWQKKTIWAALTLLALTLILVLSFGGVFLLARAVGFLQPVLLPVAVAGILAYLLDPVVTALDRRIKLSRLFAVIVVFGIFIIAGFGFSFWQIPKIVEQSKDLIERFPDLIERARTTLESAVEEYRESFVEQEWLRDAEAWVQERWPDLAGWIWDIVQSSVGGFLGGFGFLVSMILVPIYLFVFLYRTDRIRKNWHKYLPLRASGFRDDLVTVLTQINGYLANYFRGQVLVSLIDAAMTTILLMTIVRLEGALVIGLLMATLGIIPYLGMILTLIPTVLLAAAQFGDLWHPILVTIIFLAVQNFNGLVIAPKIVGDSVGLHPLTVIFSLFFWSAVVGGLLGALLAVPLTATLKVLISHYIWKRSVLENEEDDPGSSGDDNDQTTLAETGSTA
ncbi:MAG: AI-2E family transporter [Verrucomicrobiales bacterium]